VRLTTLGELNGVSTNTLGPNAIVTITEIDGTTVELVEGNIAGQYHTTPGQIVGTVGKSYQLSIKLSNGEEYQSSVEVLPEPISMVASEAIFVEEFIEQSSGVNLRSVHHDIYVEVENTGKSQFFKLENSGWAKVEIGYGTCEPGPPWSTLCWHYREPVVRNAIEIGTNQGLNSGNYKLNAFSIPVDFKHQYIAMTQLKAMSSVSYDYWKDVQEQIERPGGLFDRPFAPIAGNVSRNNGLPALGYFHAYAITSETVCFDRAEVSARISIPVIGCLDQCIEFWGPISTFVDMGQILCQ
ncbi:MAG: DUF4249 family protein, partial [Cyclobacteriaceae bacterium]